MSAVELFAAMKALFDAERDRFLHLLVEDAEWREDLQDSIILAEREKEPSRPLADVERSVGLN